MDDENKHDKLLGLGAAGRALMEIHKTLLRANAVNDNIQKFHDLSAASLSCGSALGNYQLLRQEETLQNVLRQSREMSILLSGGATGEFSTLSKYHSLMASLAMPGSFAENSRLGSVSRMIEATSSLVASASYDIGGIASRLWDSDPLSRYSNILQKEYDLIGRSLVSTLDFSIGRSLSDIYGQSVGWGRTATDILPLEKSICGLTRAAAFGFTQNSSAIIHRDVSREIILAEASKEVILCQEEHSCTLDAKDYDFSATDIECMDYLESISPQLMVMYKGAIDASRSSISDRSRHVAVSLREMISSFCRMLAPDDEVIPWINGKHDLLHDGKPTRTARLKYICRKSEDSGMSAIVGYDIRSTMELFKYLSKLHDPSFHLDDRAQEVILARVRSFVIFMKGVRGAN